MPDDVTDPSRPSNRSGVRGHGRLELTFRQDAEGRSYLAEQFATYPFHVCRTQHLDHQLPDMATLYLQSCSGGVFAGDRLSAEFRAVEGAKAHVTTQASTIVHRTDDSSAAQSTVLVAERNSLLEYLPDPAILFPGAHYRSKVVATCHPESDLIVCDSFLNHDPDGRGGRFAGFESELTIRDQDSAVMAIDRFSVSGDQFAGGELSDGEPYSVHGTLTVVSARVDLLALRQTLRAEIDALAGIYAGVSLLPNDRGLWLRYLAADGVAARTLVTAAWSAARVALTGFSPTLRRK